MKVVFRKHTFETNSSSHHSIILTNPENLKKDIKKEDKECNPFMYGAHEPLTTVKDKALFMAGMFDYEIKQMNWMKVEYKVFLDVLKDNKEEEILLQIAANREQYFSGEIDEPMCSYFFENGCLIDCFCGFSQKFRKFFGVDLGKYELLEENKDSNNDYFLSLKEEYDKARKVLYDKLYDFLYNEGLLVPYEYM